MSGCYADIVKPTPLTEAEIEDNTNRRLAIVSERYFASQRPDHALLCVVFAALQKHFHLAEDHQFLDI